MHREWFTFDICPAHTNWSECTLNAMSCSALFYLTHFILQMHTADTGCRFIRIQMSIIVVKHQQNAQKCYRKKEWNIWLSPFVTKIFSCILWTWRKSERDIWSDWDTTYRVKYIKKKSFAVSVDWCFWLYTYKNESVYLFISFHSYTNMVSVDSSPLNWCEASHLFVWITRTHVEWL